MFGGIALVLAIASADVPSAAEAADASWSAWADTIEEKGWTYLGEGQEQIVFTRPAPAAGQYRRAWVRHEFWSGRSARSMVVLSEFDCAQARSRTLQLAGYAENNLLGEGRMSQQAADNWSFAIPGTVQARVVEYVCA